MPHEDSRSESSITRQAVERAERAERELARTRQSAAYVVGSLLVKAARDPRRLLRLPRDLWRIWRLRRHRRAASPSRAPTGGRVDLSATRLLLPRLGAAPPDGSLSIVGALSEATARAWSPYASVSAALPHEAAALVHAVDPDVVVIDTSASLSGESWAHLGDPAGVDRLLAARALVDAAHDMGRPVVMLRMTPPSHTVFLDRLAARCDLVVDGPGSVPHETWHPGIDPLDTVPMASTPGLLLATGDASDDAGLRAGAPSLRVVRPDPTLPPHLSWRRALADCTGVLLDATPRGIMGTPSLALSALASGRRVLTPGDDDLVAFLGRRPAARTALITAPDMTTLAAAVGTGPEPLTATEHHAALATILLDASAPVQLTRLAQSLGSDLRPRSCWDIALTAVDDVDPDDILAQSWRPREVVVGAPLSDRARTALQESGITVVAAPSTDMSTLLRLGLTSPYVATGMALRDPHDLVDLLARTLTARATSPKVDGAQIVSLR